jgi:hypothetical protein
LKLAGAVSQGSGAINEDGWGMVGTETAVSAAWIFDGVTGINGRSYLPGGSDAAWLVARAGTHLADLAAGDSSLADILSKLVGNLGADWDAVRGSLDLPPDYDPPAACLVLVKRYGNQWRALRLGDSCLLARSTGAAPVVAAASPNKHFDDWLAREAGKRRAAGVSDNKVLMAEFRDRLKAGRSLRNTPRGYAILEAAPRAKDFAEYLDLGAPGQILLCTDGYYRAVDHYQLFDDEGLIDATAAGVDAVLARLRGVEAGDPLCQTYLRFKPADDATAVLLEKT